MPRSETRAFIMIILSPKTPCLLPEGVGLSRAATAAEVALNMSSVRMLDMTERSGSHLCSIQAIVYGIASPQRQKVTY